jgi:hypothetical protein
MLTGTVIRHLVIQFLPVQTNCFHPPGVKVQDITTHVIMPNAAKHLMGCVATALGQIMRYHQYPTSFNWSNMPLTYSTSTTASLLKKLGNSDKLNMSYGCDASASNTGNIPGVLTGYDYTSGGSYQDFNRFTVESDLYSGYPVILAGGRNAGGGFLETAKVAMHGLETVIQIRCTIGASRIRILQTNKLRYLVDMLQMLSI